jgi:hypothetical protein
MKQVTQIKSVIHCSAPLKPGFVADISACRITCSSQPCPCASVGARSLPDQPTPAHNNSRRFMMRGGGGGEFVGVGKRKQLCRVGRFCSKRGSLLVRVGPAGWSPSFRSLVLVVFFLDQLAVIVWKVSSYFKYIFHFILS